ncbi:LysR substrate-binding domain-containing protein [Pollutimonas bauzanensis]|jgi:DNA-binding transcriptional LysR family regulator|uniref:LysR substrate-binding domain-containing protein n=1 Tax=Pollutimonas bauzanensis TaxID=658167 RepID=UPI00333F202A
MTLDLRSLRSFVAVASAGSISAAAESQHIAQPALSVQVKQLEEHLGTPLFDRHARGVTLTAAGDRFLVHAMGILRRVDVACEDVRSAVDEPSGRVSIALPQSVAKFVTVPLVQNVVRQWPKIRLQMVEMSTGYIPDQLLRGQIDIGVTFGTEDDARLQFSHLMDEELVLATSRHQLLNLRIPPAMLTDGVALKSIDSLPMVLPTTAHSLRRRIEEYLSKESVSLNVIAEVNAIPELIELAVAGVGSTILSFAAINEPMTSGRLLALQIKSPKMTRSIYLGRSATLPMSIAAIKVQDLLHKTIDDLVACGAWPCSVPAHA